MWDIIDVFGFSFIGSVVIGLSIGFYSLVQPHHISRYYISTAENGGIRVMSDIEWQADDCVFSTDDVNKAIDVMNKLNATILQAKS